MIQQQTFYYLQDGRDFYIWLGLPIDESKPLMTRHYPSAANPNWTESQLAQHAGVWFAGLFSRRSRVIELDANLQPIESN